MKYKINPSFKDYHVYKNIYFIINLYMYNNYFYYNIRCGTF